MSVLLCESSAKSSSSHCLEFTNSSVAVDAKEMKAVLASASTDLHPWLLQVCPDLVPQSRVSLVLSCAKIVRKRISETDRLSRISTA